MSGEGKSEASLPTTTRFSLEAVFDYETPQIYFTVEFAMRVYPKRRYHEQKKDDQKGPR